MGNERYTMLANQLRQLTGATAMMPDNEFLFFASLRLFAATISVSRSMDDGLFTVFIRGEAVTYSHSEHRAQETAINLFNAGA